MYEPTRYVTVDKDGGEGGEGVKDQFWKHNKIHH